MNIREIEQADIDSYFDLRFKLDAESDTWGVSYREREKNRLIGSKSFNSLLKDPRSTIFLVEDDGEIVGFLSLETSAWESLSRTTTLMVGVLASQQGKGVASKLFQTAEAWARKAGIHRIELLVFSTNAPAIKLYEKLGYAHEGIRKESSYVNGAFVDELYMAKILN